MSEYEAIVDFGTNRGGGRQLRRHWRPAGPPRALALIVHGIAEHSARYAAVGEQLAAAGIGAVAYDQRGHGKTDGRRNHIDSFEEFLDDVEDQIAELRSFGVPVVLIGHSMGGLIASTYCVSDRPQPDLLVLSGPALGTGLVPWQQTMIAKLAQLAPRFFVVPRFPSFDSAVLSRDPQVCADYDADPLIKPGGTAQLLAEILSYSSRTSASVASLSLPVRCMHGDADELVPVQASAVLEGLENVTRTVYPNLRHEIFNEPEGPVIVADMIAWIDEHLGAI